MRLKFDPGIFCRFFLRWMLITMALATLNSVQAAPFTNNSDGTTTDSATGLTWMRCSMGQRWTGSTCGGTASTYTYDRANALTGTFEFAGQRDWRLPNIRELQTIVDRSVSDPAIDFTAFPSTPTSLNFWSSSLYAYNSGYAWSVSFSLGNASYGVLSSNIAVRLVRGGQSFGSLLGLTRPTSDYVDNLDGTVTHTPTNLMWKRCAEEMFWTGSTCSGPSSTYTFYQANALPVTTIFAGKDDWRLPTEYELLSLVDYSIASPGPTINTSMFPNAPSLYFWSGSRLINNSGSAWYVDFSDGYAYGDGRSVSGAVRRVRTASCTYTLSSSSTSVGYSGGSGSVTVTSPSPSCTGWTSSSNASWITITSRGNGSVGYSVAANTSTSTRTGTLTIAGQTFTVTQDPNPVCTYTLSSSSTQVDSGGGSGLVTVTQTSACTGWTASSNASWITITSSGGNSLSYSVAANTSTSSRTGTLTIAGQTFTVTQSGSNCTYTLSSSSTSVASGGGSGSVTVTKSQSCGAWTSSSNASWITITSSGSSSVSYSVAENTSTLPRTGTLTIAGQTFTVTQIPNPSPISENGKKACRLYQSAFDRAPDAGGLAYWTGRLDTGTTLERVAEEFIGSAEFKRLYGPNPTNEEYLTKLYNNVLHRAPEQAGYDWWLGQINSGYYSRARALVSFSESAENKANAVACY